MSRIEVTTAEVAARVRLARQRQRDRYGEAGPRCNAEADGAVLETTVQAEPAARELLELAAERLRLSPRGFIRTLRVARTIADLAGAERIALVHAAEALQLQRVLPG